MKSLLILVAVLLLACGGFSCMQRRYRTNPVGQRDATVPAQDEERVEELESTEKTITSPWHEKSP